uniref:Uncharacterized protein n=1 Tax=Myotis myotis TaxID=51298 RepID=A0A7J7Z5D6_MYOMY|nr:hypothetical protein mMyoMyo1_010548 [Myotis myotis]
MWKIRHCLASIIIKGNMLIRPNSQTTFQTKPWLRGLSPLHKFHASGLQYIIKGIRRSKSKPINYSRQTTIIQEINKNPGTFLEKLREALIKHTNITPDSLERQLILKDKFSPRRFCSVDRASVC